MFRDKPLLFKHFTELVGEIPWRSIGTLPTTVGRMEKLEQTLSYDTIWIKRDDLSGDKYGGNKIRKLEFVLADALNKNKKQIMTFGGLGSNHALATAIYAKELGLGSILVLIDQPLTEHVQEQLLLYDYFGSQLSYAKNTAGAVIKALWHLATKRGVYFLWVGGSSPLGTLGFVDAGFELAQQVELGLVPKPDYVFIATGSMGTAAGLKVGFALAGLETDLVCVRVTDRSMTDEKKTAKLCNRAMDLLRSASKEIPEVKFTPNDIHMVHDFAGLCYGSVTEEGLEAVQIAHQTEGIRLETTYTAKAFACMIDYIKNGRVSGPVLFWNTYNSVDLTHIVKEHHDFTRLPKSFHKFFHENLISYI
jgi:1-aminocyclopropane-1-carboxylate deaminase/D-cysteine desulfhydrase-like pyridoxal-dependent ACC family enzyme